jgi:hypothetical protein
MPELSPGTISVSDWHGAAEATESPADFILQGFLGYTQQQRNWCWAAACVTINNYFSDPSWHLQQCEVVNMVLNETDCCLAPTRYDIPWSLQYALAEVGHLTSQTPGPVDAVGGFAAVVREIGIRHAPVAVRHRRHGGGDHFVVIYGYKERGRSLLVWDPSGHYVQTSFVNWLADIGEWMNTYFTR